eukprot:gene7288-7359_t
MTNTTSTYIQITTNLKSAQAATAKLPDVKVATAYYQKNIGKVTSIDSFVNNYKLLSYALTAYGMEDQIQNTGLIKRVLAGGTTNTKSLANTLTDKRFLNFAKAFAAGPTHFAAPAAVANTVSAYTEQKLEDNAGQQDSGVQMALYFKRIASSITDPYQILGSKQLTQVIQTALGLPSVTSGSAAALDNQAAAIKTALNGMKDLKDPAKVNKLAERFTANYDMLNTSASTSSTNTLFGGNSSSASRI